MSDERDATVDEAVDVGEYCRGVEDYLTRANAGHLVRIVGPSFELVRTWALAGVPLSVVYRGIDLKAERHRDSGSTRPLRIEFCAADVQSVFDRWRRAVGIVGVSAVGASEDGARDENSATPRRPSLTKHLDRAIDRLSRAMSQVDWPEGLRDECVTILDALARLRESAAGARGAARDEAAQALRPLDDGLGDAALRHAPTEWLASLREDAAADLAPFRGRLGPDAWERAVAATLDRLLRDRLGLPTLDL